MIARSWECRTKPGRTAAFLEYLERTGLAAAREMPGYEGHLLTRRPAGVADAEAELRLVTLWRDMEAIRCFAGDSPGLAVTYPEDCRYLARGDETVMHAEVVARET